MTEKFEKIEEESPPAKTEASRADVIESNDIEARISEFFLEKLRGKIDQKQFDEAMARIFEVDAVDVKEVKAEDGSVSKLEIRDKANGEELAYFDVESIDRHLDEEAKLEIDRSEN